VVLPQQHRATAVAGLRMRKLAHIFTDLFLGPPPTSLGAAAASAAPVASPADHEGVAQVVVVDEVGGHLHDFLGLFPEEDGQPIDTPPTDTPPPASQATWPLVERRRVPRPSPPPTTV
jgi:hypothetical protein